MKVALITGLVLATACASAPPQQDPACPVRVHFAGLDWNVSSAAERFPGAAHGFAWDACNVRVDSSAGREILTLVLRKENGRWRGAQLASDAAYQYGTFSMNLESPLRPMLTKSPSAVLGFFAYAGPSYSNEIDVEFTRWGNPRLSPMHYTVWHNVRSGTPPPEAAWSGGDDSQLLRPSVHRFTWTSRSVSFESFSANGGAPIGKKFTVKSNVPAKPMRIMLNLWVQPETNMGYATTYEVKISSVAHSL